jgi:hypothetical protein
MQAPQLRPHAAGRCSAGSFEARPATRRVAVPGHLPLSKGRDARSGASLYPVERAFRRVKPPMEMASMHASAAPATCGGASGEGGWVEGWRGPGVAWGSAAECSAGWAAGDPGGAGRAARCTPACPIPPHPTPTPAPPLCCQHAPGRGGLAQAHGHASRRACGPGPALRCRACARPSVLAPCAAAAAHHDVRVPALHHAEGVAHRVHACGAGGGDRVVGAQQLVPGVMGGGGRGGGGGWRAGGACVYMRAPRFQLLLGCWAAGLLGCRAAGLLGCWAAGLPGCWAAGLPGCRAAGLPGREAACACSACCRGGAPDGHGARRHVVQDPGDEEGGHLAQLPADLQVRGTGAGASCAVRRAGAVERGAGAGLSSQTCLPVSCCRRCHSDPAASASSSSRATASAVLISSRGQPRPAAAGAQRQTQQAPPTICMPASAISDGQLMPAPMATPVRSRWSSVRGSQPASSRAWGGGGGGAAAAGQSYSGVAGCSARGSPA